MMHVNISRKHTPAATTPTIIPMMAYVPIIADDDPTVAVGVATADDDPTVAVGVVDDEGGKSDNKKRQK